MTDPHATLQAWRDGGLDRRDPVRFRLIEVLAQRAEGYAGAARKVLDERIGTLMAAYAKTHADAHQAPLASTAADTLEDGTVPQDPNLSTLTAYLRGRPRDSQQTDARADQARQDAYPELAALDDFRAIWEHLRTDRQVQESLQQMPGENAGPLNAGNIVHRSLSLMRAVSPEYLRQFMTYLDSLSALERLCQAGDPAGLLVAKLDGNKKGGRKAR